MLNRNLRKYTDEELVAGLKNKEETAFSYLVKNYSLALKKAIERPDVNVSSDDLLQDTFIKIWENIERFDETKGRLFTWMVVIARRIVSTDLTSKNHKKSRVTTAIEEYLDVHPYLKDPDNYLDTNGDMLNVLELVQTYAPDHTEIIKPYLEGYPCAEIGQQKGLNITTVRARIHKSMNNIKGGLSKDLFYLKKSGEIVSLSQCKIEKEVKAPEAFSPEKLALGKQVKALKAKGHRMKYIAGTLGVCITTCHVALRQFKASEGTDAVSRTLEQEKIRLGKKISGLRLKKLSIKAIAKKLKISPSTCYSCLRYLDEVKESKKDYGAYLKKMREIAGRVRLSQKQGDTPELVAKTMGIRIDTCYNALRMFK